MSKAKTKPKPALVELESVVCEICPTCAGVFVGQTTVMRRTTDIPDGTTEEKWEHKIMCVKGHKFDIAMRDDTHWLLRVPKQTALRQPMRAVATRKPCQGCGRAIRPGEIYTGGVQAPRHIGC